MLSHLTAEPLGRAPFLKCRVMLMLQVSSVLFNSLDMSCIVLQWPLDGERLPPATPSQGESGKREVNKGVLVSTKPSIRGGMFSLSACKVLWNILLHPPQSGAPAPQGRSCRILTWRPRKKEDGDTLTHWHTTTWVSRSKPGTLAAVCEWWIRSEKRLEHSCVWLAGSRWCHANPFQGFTHTAVIWSKPWQPRGE